jgi:hypothetical protein
MREGEEEKREGRNGEVEHGWSINGRKKGQNIGSAVQPKQ